MMMKIILGVAVFLIVVMFVFVNRSTDPALQKLIQDGAALIDVRTPKEFAGGSVDGAINIPLSDVESRLGEFKGKKNIVVFCRSGNRSGKAMQILQSNGFDNVMNGGSWKAVKEIVDNKGK